MKTSIDSTSPGKERHLAPIDLAKFLRQRYVDPGSTFDSECATMDAMDPSHASDSVTNAVLEERVAVHHR